MTAPSTEQTEMLLNFLEEHRDLTRGVLRNVEGRLQAQRLWGEICSTHNVMGGYNKTVQQWQKVWTDKKYLAKTNVVAVRRSATATGGGPSLTPSLPETQIIREIHTVIEPLQPTVGGRLTATPMEQPSTQRSTHSRRERRMRTLFGYAAMHTFLTRPRPVALIYLVFSDPE